MCHNHSHIAAEHTGVLVVGETLLVEYLVTQPLTVEMPYGEKLTLSAGTTLLLPASRLVPLPASRRRLMEVCYIPSSFTEEIDTTTGQVVQMRPNTHGIMPVTSSSAGDVSPEIRTVGHEQPAF